MIRRDFKRKDHRWVSTGTGQVSGTLMTYLRRKAKERELEFSVTSEELWNLFLKQKGKCALSGVDLKLSTTINKQNNLERKEMTASLDRKDNNKGYTLDNVQWIHKTVNLMRRQYSIEEYVYWCSLVSYHANIERSCMNEKLVMQNVQRLDGEDSTNNPSKSAQPLEVG